MRERIEYEEQEEWLSKKDFGVQKKIGDIIDTIAANGRRVVKLCVALMPQRLNVGVQIIENGSLYLAEIV